MVRWVVGSILYGVDPLSYFSFQPVLHDWCNKGHGMCYPVCGMVHIKEPLLLNKIFPSFCDVKNIFNGDMHSGEPVLVHLTHCDYILKVIIIISSISFIIIIIITD